MTARELERCLHGLTMWTPTDTTERLRRLREMRMLPVTGRGLSAAQIGPEHAATILIAMAAAERAPDAAFAASTYGALPPESGRYADPIGTENFGDALATILGDINIAARVQSLRVYRDRPEAVLRIATSGGDVVEARYIAVGAGLPGAARVVCEMNGSLIAEVASELDGDGESGGWTGKGDGA